MFERYTEKARRTIFFAKHEASQFGSPHIEPEHLLLGLFNDGFLASRVLEGISVQRLREEILSLLPRASPTSGDLPLSASAKKALSYGAEEADRLGDRQIRNQHLLLGIMRIEDCSAARLLTQKGLRPESLRVRIAGLSPEEDARWSAGQMTSVDNNDPLTFYLRELATIQPLTKDEETNLLQRVRSQDEQAESAGRRLIEAKLALVVSIAKRHSSAGIDMLDLIQKGNEGLLLALNTFAGGSSENFATHAATCIEDAVSKAIAESQSASE